MGKLKDIVNTKNMLEVLNKEYLIDYFRKELLNHRDIEKAMWYTLKNEPLLTLLEDQDKSQK